MEDGVGAGLAAAGGGLAGAAVGAAAGAAAGFGTMSGGVRTEQGQTQGYMAGSSAYPPGSMSMDSQGLGPPAAGGFIAGTASTGQSGPGQPFMGTREVSAVKTQEPASIDRGFMARVSDAVGLGSTTQNQAGSSWASNAVMAATAAAGAAVGGALNAVRGSNVDDQHGEQAQWREEVDNPARGTVKQGIARVGTAQEFYSGAVDLPKPIAAQQKKRTTVAIVVSAVEAGRGTAEIDAHAVSLFPSCRSPTDVMTSLFSPISLIILMC